MKLLATLLSFLGIASAVQATVRTVSNNGFPAQYTSLTAAITAANAGDSIYISGSATSYGGIALTKSLTLIGEASWPATGSGVWLDWLDMNAGAEGSRITGLQVWHNANYATVVVNCDNIVLERCYIGRGNNHYTVGVLNVTGTRTGLTVRHCYIEGGRGSSKINLNNMSAVVLANNVIQSGGPADDNLLANSNQSTVTITNNLFMYSWAGGYALAAIQNALVANNIFWGPGARINGSVTGSMFNNNLTYENGGGAMPPPNNSGTGNLANTNPQFVNAPDRNLNNTYNYTPQLAAALTGGSDGTAIGIMGGSLPWPNNNGYPRLPRVTGITLANGTIPQGSNLNVTSNGTKVD